MTISKQNTVINSIKTTLENITEVNSFQSTVIKVLRGIRVLDDFSAGDLPGLAIFKTANNVDETYQQGSEDRLVLHIWGFVTVEARENNYDNLDKLVADVESILHNSSYNSYYNNTFIKNTNFYEGGVQDSFGFFDMEIEVSYFHTLGDI
jgi:hypothetical protein